MPVVDRLDTAALPSDNLKMGRGESQPIQADVQPGVVRTAPTPQAGADGKCIRDLGQDDQDGQDDAQDGPQMAVGVCPEGKYIM